jgi:hypothetical protein
VHKPENIFVTMMMVMIVDNNAGRMKKTWQRIELGLTKY